MYVELWGRRRRRSGDGKGNGELEGSGRLQPGCKINRGMKKRKKEKTYAEQTNTKKYHCGKSDKMTLTE